MSLSRRDLLVAGGATAAGLISASAFPASPSPAPPVEPFAFVFFSDTHIGLKANLEANAAMVEEIVALRPEIVINGGDVTDYGWAAEYANYRRVFAPLRVAGIPQRFIAGNHDVRWSPRGPMAFSEGLAEFDPGGGAVPMRSAFTHRGVRFLLLDSTVPLSHYGHFEAEMLRWVERELAALPPKTPLLVFTHHWIGREAAMVDDEERLLALLRRHPAAHIFTGHGHSDLLWTWDGVACSMNKGLYQGSWMRVEVDPVAGELRIARRSGEPKSGAAAPVEVWRGPFHPPAPRPDATAELARLDSGAWAAPEAVAAASLSPGPHRVALKRGTRYSTAPPRVGAEDGRTIVRARALLSGGVMSHLRLDGDEVFVSQMDGAVAAFDADSLRPKWRAKSGGYCHSSPLVTERLVVVGSADGFVRGLDRASGRERWRFRTRGPVYASAATVGETVACPSGDGNVYGLDLATGERRWTFALPPSNTNFVQSPVAADESGFYFGAWDGFLYALDAVTGGVRWRRDCLDGKSFAYSPAIGGPLVVGDLVVVPANGNILWAFRRGTGDVAWRTTSPGDKFGYSSPAARESRIVVGCLGAKGEFRAVEAEDGAIAWTCATGSEIYDSGPALGRDWAAITNVAGGLAIAGLADGRLRAGRQLPVGHALSTPIARGDDLWVATFAGELARIEVSPE